jgi:hypothetical protein
MDPSDLRILEIGDHHHFKLTLPLQTTLLWTGSRAPRHLSATDYADWTPFKFRRALRDVTKQRYDLVVTYSQNRTPWHPRNWVRSIAHSPLTPLAALSRVFGVSMLRFVALPIPLIAIDMQDGGTIHSCNFFLLDKAKLFLKRELPVDHWQVLQGSAHAGLPTLRIRRSARWRERIDKLRPVSLQARPIETGPPGEVFAAKTTDVFFAGAIESNSTVRSAGLAELKGLASRGLRVDIAAERLSADEYHRRLAQAWLAWSPSGLGWDCYRHYEAPQCLSVPIINYPTISRYEPLIDGIHAFYYAPEPGGLTRAIEAAIQDKKRLEQIALAGRQHVRAHHVGGAFCARVIAAAFDRSA